MILVNTDDKKDPVMDKFNEVFPNVKRLRVKDQVGGDINAPTISRPKGDRIMFESYSDDQLSEMQPDNLIKGDK